METIKKLLSDILNIEFVQAVLSNPRKKEGILKVKVRPIEKKGNLFFQLESFTKTQAFHENLDRFRHETDCWNIWKNSGRCRHLQCI